MRAEATETAIWVGEGAGEGGRQAGKKGKKSHLGYWGLRKGHILTEIQYNVQTFATPIHPSALPLFCLSEGLISKRKTEQGQPLVMS